MSGGSRIVYTTFRIRYKPKYSYIDGGKPGTTNRGDLYINLILLKIKRESATKNI
jgi:hypothetical protein